MKFLQGLKFAKNRWSAKDAGTLKVGQKKHYPKRGSLCYYRASSMEIKKLENDDCQLS